MWPGSGNALRVPVAFEHQVGFAYTPASMSHASPIADGKNRDTVSTQRIPGVDMTSTVANQAILVLERNGTRDVRRMELLVERHVATVSYQKKMA